MKTLGNIIWVVFGGLELALGYFFGGFVLMVTVIGIPFGVQCMKIGLMALWPFGSNVVKKESASGCISFVMNVIWFFFGGIELFLSHLLLGIIFFVTIVGIPFGRMHFRLAGIALCPFGKDVVRI